MTEMSKDDIETLSANAVENSCAKTQYLTASLRKRDKEPSWDGEIYIYNDKRKKKEDIEKTVKVQVKGTTRKKNLTKNGLSFYMNDSNMTDLKNYLNNGGCLFFVVYIDEENDSECTIYYTELLPLKIKKIISNEMKTLHLNKFPSNNEKKLKILRHFATHSTRQCSFAENGFATQEEVDKWDKNGYLNGIEICTSDGNIDVKTDFNTSHIPVILLTACSLDEQRIQGYDGGADSYISKPFNSQLLLSRVRNLIANRRQLRQFFGDNQTIEKEAISDLDKGFVSRFKSLVEERMKDAELNVEDLGRNMGMSRVQLYRKLKSLTNYSPNELLRQMRLKKAASLLASSDMTVAEIAYEVVFSSFWMRRSSSVRA